MALVEMGSVTPVVVRGHVPALMELPRGNRGQPIRKRIADAVRAFVHRHGVMPEEIVIGDHPYGVAGICVTPECGKVVLASDAGASVPLCDDCG